MDIINNEEEDTLRDSISTWNKNPTYNVAFVKKDNKDYIFVSNNRRPFDKYLFESHLPYSCEDLISLFEDASNIELTDDFLHGKETGIFFFYRKITYDWEYGFISEIDGHTYYAYYEEELKILK